MHTTTHTVSRLVAAATLSALLFGGPLASATDAAPKGPALTLSGGGSWHIREWLDDAVVNGTGTIEGKGLKATDLEVAAVIQTDDRTLPEPGECEDAFALMSAWSGSAKGRTIDVTLVGDGEVCGTHTQPGTSIVTHVFTGTYEVYGDSNKPKQLIGTDGWYEIRLAEDGSAGITAFDS